MPDHPNPRRSAPARLAVAMAAAACLVVATAEARARADLALLLAVDVSESVDAEEARLQRQGYVRAITDPDVVAAILAGPNGRVLMSYVEWAGPDHFFTIVDWTPIDGMESAVGFAARLEFEEISQGYTTSITMLLRRSRRIFARLPEPADRLVLDVSGDGPNNDGGYVVHARDRLIAGGITINGLPILNARPSPSGYPVLEDLSDYYRNCVIGGAGSFQVAASDFGTFADAIRRKLFLEIALAPLRPPEPTLRLAADEAPYDCNVGEKQSRERLRDRFQTTGDAPDGRERPR